MCLLQWEPRKFGSGRGRGGRPKGSGNRVQMAPRAAPAPAEAAVPAAEGGAAKFSLRSIKYTGVYRSRRSQEGWRAQFCYANKVRMAAALQAALQGKAGSRTAHTTHSGAHRCLSAAVPNSCQPQRPLCSCLVLPLKICNKVTCTSVSSVPVPVSHPCCMLLLLHVSVTQVINLGTFATEDEAARVWNEAALLFRGGRQAPATACGVLCIVVLLPDPFQPRMMLWVAAVVACHCCVCLHAWPTSQELRPFSVLCVCALCVLLLQGLTRGSTQWSRSCQTTTHQASCTWRLTRRPLQSVLRQSLQACQCPKLWSRARRLLVGCAVPADVVCQAGV